jgi:hypothetical protein
MDNAGPQGSEGNVRGMGQHIVPVAERGGRNRIRRDFESAKSPAQQEGNHGANGQNQKGSRKTEFLEDSHVYLVAAAISQM